MAYSKPVPCAGALTTMVPVGTAHVGCTVTEAVGAAGAAGAASTATALTGDTHVLSEVLLTVMSCEVLADAPVKVAAPW